MTLTNTLSLANGLGLAQRYGVKKTTFANWRVRYSDFPEPVHAPLVIGVPLWHVVTMDNWFRNKWPDRPLH